jgi:hypothetical protein
MRRGDSSREREKGRSCEGGREEGLGEAFGVSQDGESACGVKEGRGGCACSWGNEFGVDRHRWRSEERWVGSMDDGRGRKRERSFRAKQGLPEPVILQALVLFCCYISALGKKNRRLDPLWRDGSSRVGG